METETINYCRPASLPGTEIWFASGSSRRWHAFHETYTFCANTTVAAGWRYRGKSRVLHDASTMLIEPGETHVNTDVRRPADFKVALISPSVIYDMAHELDLSAPPHFRMAQVGDIGLFRLFQQFYTAEETDTSTLEQQSRFAACLRFPFEHCTEVSPPALTAGAEHAALTRTADGGAPATRLRRARTNAGRTAGSGRPRRSRQTPAAAIRGY